MSGAKHYENGMCMHCGGAVDDDGYALGGEVEIDEPEETSNPEELDDGSPQGVLRDRLRSFAESVKGKAD